GLHVLRGLRAVHSGHRPVPGRLADGTQGRAGNAPDTQVSDIWRCATIGRVEYNRSRGFSVRGPISCHSFTARPYFCLREGLQAHSRSVLAARMWWLTDVFPSPLTSAFPFFHAFSSMSHFLYESPSW